MGQDWEQVRPPGSRWRGIALAFAAVVVVGLLARPTGGEAPGGLLDVAEDDARAPAAAPTPSPRLTPSVQRRPPAPTPTPTPTPTPVPELQGRWERLADPPVPHQNEAGTAWDGARRLFVYGGLTWIDDGARSVHHGAAWMYDAADDTWTELPPPPLEPRSRSSAAWTGTELVVWGGIGRTQIFADGAAFDPEQGTWRRIADGPLSPRHGATVAWTGEVLVVAGGADNAGGHADSALYDPRADRWAAGPPLPTDAPAWGNPAAGLTVDGGAVVWFPEQWGPEPLPPLRFTGDAWEPTILHDDTGMPHAPMWAVVEEPGGGLLALRGDYSNGGPEGPVAQLLRLPVGSSTWEAAEGDTVSGHDLPTGAVVADRYYMLVSGHGMISAFDLAQERWLDVPAIPRPNAYYGPLPVAPSSDGLLVLTPPVQPDAGAELWRFRIDGEGEPPAAAAQSGDVSR